MTKGKFDYIVERLKAMSPEEVFQLAVKIGLYTPDGQLTEKYKQPEDRQRKDE